MRRAYPPLLLVLLHVVLLLAGQVSAAPIAPSNGNLSGPTTVTTVRQTETALGTVTETCQITLIPETRKGQKVVKEVKKCTVSVDAKGTQGGNGTGSNTSGSGSTAPPPSASSQVSSATSTNSTSSTNPPPPPPPPSTSSPPLSSAASSTSTSSSGNPVNGVSSVSLAQPTSNPASPSSSPEAASTQSPSPSTSSASAKKGGTSKTASSASPSGTDAASSAQQSSSSAFAVPGKKLSVLPIGLGVFAGISVIALIVVGLVTYERTKYRKAFRQRKLAEAGSAMGYGGMAERT